MRAVTSLVLAGAVGLGAAACTSKPGGPPGPILQGGFVVYGNGAPAVIGCDGRPIQLNGNHTDLRLSGPCRFVRVAGEHNDIAVEVPPGGSIEITGAHNDVTWVQTRPGAPPVLRDEGNSNTFHRGRAG